MQRNQEMINLYEIIKAEKKFAEEDYCFSTGKTLMKLLGTDISQPLDKFRIEYKHFLANQDSKELDDHQGERYVELLDENRNTLYFENLFKNNIFIKLFEPSKEPQHFIYNFKLKLKSSHSLFKKYNASRYKMHNFFIEKVSDGNQTSWCIYHSWGCAFNLQEWLGIDTWKLDSQQYAGYEIQIFDRLFKEYGNRKSILNEDEVKQFIKLMITIILNNSDSKYHHRDLIENPKYQFKSHFASIAVYDIAKPALTDKQTTTTQPDLTQTTSALNKENTHAGNSNASFNKRKTPRNIPLDNINGNNNSKSSCLLS